MGPAFGIGRRAQKFANLARRLGYPQELYVVARISFMNCRAENRSPVELGHELFRLLRGIGWAGHGHVEISLGRDLFKRARSVHRGGRSCADGPRRVFTRRA